MDRRTIALSLLFAAACSRGDASTAKSATPGTTRDSSGGAVAVAAPPTTPAGESAPSAAGQTGAAPTNLQGRIPVLEYHVIGGDKNTLYTRTAASYRADLEEAYKRGFRPIT